MCAQSENYTCGWNSRGNIIDVYTKRLVIAKDGNAINQIGLGSYSFMVFNLAIYTQKIQLGFSPAAYFVNDGGNHKIRFSTQYSSTDLGYNTWT